MFLNALLSQKGIINRLCVISDAWRSTSELPSSKISFRAEGDVMADAMPSSVVHLLFRVSELSCYPVVLTEMLQAREALQKSIELKKQLEAKTGSPSNGDSYLDIFLGHLDVYSQVRSSGFDSILKELSTLLPPIATGHSCWPP